jgi:dihydrofolate reductase
MRTVIAQVYDYSLDGVSAEEGTSFFDFCRALPDDPAYLERALDFYRNADVIVMGRTHYQGAAAYFPSADDDPYADVMNAARKVVFSRTLATADWPNTTVSNGDLAAEIHQLKLGGDGYVIADGGVGLLRSLFRQDLVDECRIYLVPYLAGKGPRDWWPPGDPRPASRTLRLAALGNIAMAGGAGLEAASHLHGAVPAGRLLFGARAP